MEMVYGGTKRVTVAGKTSKIRVWGRDITQEYKTEIGGMSVWVSCFFNVQVGEWWDKGTWEN